MSHGHAPAYRAPAVFDFIEGFYNPRRRHSALGQISPINFERLYARRVEADAA